MVTDSAVRLEFRSHFDMLDFVQVVSDEMGRLVGLDTDSTHWVSVAVRESVINAIKHGNREDEDKRVTVEFTLTPAGAPTRLTVRVVDQGEGFDPVEVADPLAPENLLKSSGRGIFFMRNFMDDSAPPACARGRHGSGDGQDGRRRELLGRCSRRQESEVGSQEEAGGLRRRSVLSLPVLNQLARVTTIARPSRSPISSPRPLQAGVAQRGSA